MTPEIAFVIGVLIVTIILFITEILRMDVVAILVLVTLTLTGLIDINEALSGFNNPAVITVMAIFMVSASLDRTGVADVISNLFQKAGKGSEVKIIAVIMISVAILSTVMNNVAAASILFPAVISISASTNIPASKLLIPLAFGSTFGGMITQIGTAPNLVVSSQLEQHNIPTFALLDFAPTGCIVLVVGILYMIFIGRKLLPDHSEKKKVRKFNLLAELSKLYKINERLYEAKLTNRCELIDKSLSASKLGEYYNINVAAIIRGRTVITNPEPTEIFHPKDRVLFTGEVESLHHADNNLSLGLKPSDPSSLINLSQEKTGLVEATLAPGSSLLGHTLKDINFREKYGANVIGIWRNGETISSGVGNLKLKMGDALLIQGSWVKLQVLGEDSDLLVINSTEKLPRKKKAPFAFVILILSLIPVIMGIVPVTIAMLAGAILMVLTKCITMDQAYRSVEWKIVFLMAGIIPLGTALVNTGAAEYIATTFLNPVASMGQIPLIIAVFMITSLLCIAIPNVAAAIIMGPIALGTGTALGIAPHILMFAVAYGASNGFVSPISQQSNMLVMGAGGYTFKDYVKVGLPLAILMTITVALALTFLY